MRHKVDPKTGCWNWLGPQTEQGYPINYAHRRYWEKLNGPQPDGTEMHHVCRNTLCVNPGHLEAVDRREHRLEHCLERSGLTFEDIIEIRRLGRTAGVRVPEVAERFGIGVSNVYWYWTGESWSDMDPEPGPCFPDPWPCGREDCNEFVVAQCRSKVFCSARCRSLTNARKSRERSILR